MAALRSGAYENFKLNPKELAIICSSHSGEKIHTETVASIFNKIGIEPGHLACGVHPPIDRISANQLIDDGLKPQQIHNNCSGKHAGMLCTCTQMDLTPENYLDPEHPVQQYIYDIVKEYTLVGDIHRRVDGCSAPVFYLPLSKLAMAFAIISSQRSDETQQIFQAMTSNPYLIGGNGRFDTLLMESFPGKIMSKGGAEAVSAAGFIMPDGQIYGLAVKVLDGNYRAIGQMVLSLLQDIGFIQGAMPDALNKWWKPELKNHAKHVVGTSCTILKD